MTVVEVMEVSGRHDSPKWLEHGFRSPISLICVYQPDTSLLAYVAL